VEACSADDPVRRCANGCGAGLQRCVEGLWQPCTGFDERDCDNGCASGVEYCVGDEWLPCDAPTAQSCSNGCTDGTQVCVEGTWTDCNAPFDRACTNPCGTGTERCVDGAWSACDATAVAECSTFCGPGERACRDGAWGPCSAHDPVWPVFEATVRDFHESHPDMERPGWGSHLPGLVLPELGADGKPVYSGVAYSRIESAETFDQWYRDVPGVNLATTVLIPLEPVTSAAGTFRFSDPYFFPIDGQLFGNEGNTNNFHFTLELVTRFRYFGGEVFSFSGDDDLWVFINGRLAIDLGGEHEELSATVYLDESATELDIVPDNEYSLHLFFAERHTLESHFTIETTIKDWDACP
jgi:fibro-slime domain-containing protein